MNKRTSKPRTQYSPSEPIATTTYHLIVCTTTKNLVIIGNSSVKRIDEDGVLLLNDGRSGTLIRSGTKAKCIHRWNDMIRENLDTDMDEAEEDGENSATTVRRTLQAPSNTFMTPAPYRRKKATTIRSISPDSVNDSSLVKRFASSNETNQPNQRHNSNRELNFTLLASSNSSSEDDENDLNDCDVSLNKIFLELKNTQSNIRDARTENQDIHVKISKLTQKIHQFKSFVFSKTDQDLDRYRDPSQKETFPDSITFEGRDLLNERARNPGQYARNLLRILFTREEMQSCILPSTQSKRYLKPELDSRRMDLLHNSLRTRYRIGRHFYDSFYTERIQATLAACLYNEGRRKLKKKSSEETDRVNVEERTTIESTSTIQFHTNL